MTTCGHPGRDESGAALERPLKSLETKRLDGFTTEYYQTRRNLLWKLGTRELFLFPRSRHGSTPDSVLVLIARVQLLTGLDPDTYLQGGSARHGAKC
jgi:hypothetical protein